LRFVIVDRVRPKRKCFREPSPCGRRSQATEICSESPLKPNSYQRETEPIDCGFFSLWDKSFWAVIGS